MTINAAARALVDAHEARVAAPDRKSRGVFYTPPAAVDVALDATLDGALEACGDPTRLRVLDPAAGAGAFLLGAHARVAALLAARGTPRPWATALAALHGIDLDPDALQVAAQALLLQASVDRPTEIEARNLRKCLVVADALEATLHVPRAHLVVGNPPYGTNGAQARMRLSARFPTLSGEIDRFSAFTLRALELCAPHGTVALVLPDTWLTSRAGTGLRVSITAHAAVLSVHDLGKAFRTAKDTRVHVLALRNGSEALDATIWSDGKSARYVSQRSLAAQAERGWWLYRTDTEQLLCERLALMPTLGDRHRVFYGLRTGDNGRFVSRESGLLPLIGGEDVQPFLLRKRPKWLTAIASKHRKNLERQRALRVVVQRIRTNSARPSARWIEAAPALNGEVCLDSLSYLVAASAENAFALTAWLCSAPINRLYKLHYTDVNVRPTTLSTLPVPHDLERLGVLGRERANASFEDAIQLERAIDAEVYRQLGCTSTEVETIECGYWGREPRPTLTSCGSSTVLTASGSTSQD